MLRGKKLTRNVTVPVSAGLLTNTEAYRQALTSYRVGDIDPIVQLIAEASILAIDIATDLIRDVHAIKARWQSSVKTRSDSAIWRVLDLVAIQPAATARTVAQHLAISPTNVYGHLHTLTDLGILQVDSKYLFGQLYRSDEILGALDDSLCARSVAGSVRSAEREGMLSEL
jgi:hypothetical protein